MKAVLIWAVFATVIGVPTLFAVQSPLLAWRDPVYILAGFAGVAAMVLLFVQPLLAGGYLPGVSVFRGRRVHRLTGVALVLAVVVHVGALWITSPPDVIDALLFVSPTLFSAWGVVAMWAVFAAGLLAIFRRRLRLWIWRMGHTLLGASIVVGSVVHAMLIDGTMEQMSKAVLCLFVVWATVRTIIDLRAWAVLARVRK